jgi:hypothetical protein
MKYDIIGDIHGHADQLIQMLEDMGYRKRNGFYRHHEHDRKAIFVGDFIDRGPKIRKTLEIVKAMVENKAAQAVLGNHEYNALCFHTKKTGRTNAWLRPHTEKNKNQHRHTLDQFNNYQEEWKKYLAWFMTLPLFLDLGDIRVVHASWIPSEIEKIKKWTSETRNLTRSLLQKSALEGFDEFDAIEAVLKGVEIPLPEGETFRDHEKNERGRIRIRWWEPVEDKTYGEMVFPSTYLKCGKKRIDPEEAAKLEAYNDPGPVFFGHYWRLPKKHELRLQADNICCLDYSVAKGGNLVSYRWEGELKLNKKHFKHVNFD